MAWYGPLNVHNHALNDVAQIHYEEMAGNVGGVASTTWRTHGTHREAYRGHIKINTTLDLPFSWYKGQSFSGLQPWQYDLWSAVTHEVGHWIVLGDLPAGDLDGKCWMNNNNEATMCQGLGPAETFKRTPDTAEDKNSANTGY